PSGALFDVSAQRSGGLTMVELEPAGPEGVPLGVVLGDLEAAASDFERASTVEQLCRFAAAEFRRLTGFDRVMIYQFLDDDSGSVVGEDRREGLRSFLNHRFPASDIPRQARALYLRNPIRVIPDVDYKPAPLQPATLDGGPIDLSDVALRSVSPIHLQYLRNMGVRASASVSIVKDGVLWGLVACHNETPLHIPFARRAACRALAGTLGRQIRAKDESDAFRERVRLRGFQDDLVALLSREGSLDAAISNHVAEIRRALGGDGVAILRGSDLLTNGRCPAEEETRAVAAWALNRSVDQVFSTARLVELLPDAESYRHAASGLLAITLSLSEPWIVMWFRAEEIEVVEWAGNPHKDVAKDPNEALTPRASFESWRETVRGRARRWTGPEIEAAGRLRAAVTEVWQSRRLRDLNRRLVAALDEKDLLIQQKDFLVGEVNHRVQNSLQLVSSFLALQARASDQPVLAHGVPTPAVWSPDSLPAGEAGPFVSKPDDGA
ncbi:GAF domain-containing protein, partial [Hansschlegelia beijingensis]